jgi:hypothetical protein
MMKSRVEAPADAFLSEAELAKRWRRSVRTLQRWREKEISPAYLRLFGRVLYKHSDIMAYEAAARIERPTLGSEA